MMVLLILLYYYNSEPDYCMDSFYRKYRAKERKQHASYSTGSNLACPGQSQELELLLYMKSDVYNILI